MATSENAKDNTTSYNQPGKGGISGISEPEFHHVEYPEKNVK